MWQSIITVGQKNWEASFVLAEHASQEEAEQFAQHGIANPTLAISGNRFAIALDSNGETIYRHDEELTFLCSDGSDFDLEKLIVVYGIGAKLNTLGWSTREVQG